MNLVLIVILLISASLGALLAKSRNRTPWKGALLGILPITLLGMMIFLKTKGERTKKNKIIDRIIVGSFLFLIIGGAITRTVVNAQLNDTLQKYNKNLDEDKDKTDFIIWLNSNADAGITFKSDSEKLIIMTSLEVLAKSLEMPYKIAESSFKDDSAIDIYTKVMVENMKKSDKKMIPNLKKLGFKYVQANILYKNGEIQASTVENIN